MPARPSGALLSRGCYSTIGTLVRTPVVHRPQNENYKKTLGNLKINETTRVMYQGFTGAYPNNVGGSVGAPIMIYIWRDRKTCKCMWLDRLWRIRSIYIYSLLPVPLLYFCHGFRMFDVLSHLCHELLTPFTLGNRKCTPIN